MTGKAEVDFPNADNSTAEAVGLKRISDDPDRLRFLAV